MRLALAHRSRTSPKDGPALKMTISRSHADLFVVVAESRVLAQVRGVKQLIEARNFPCAAAITRMQIYPVARFDALFAADCGSARCA